jgi:hypothetical protein
MADPATALAETRRVLRPGGCLALAVWDSIELNPWAALPALELRERGLAPAAQDAAPAPGPFTLASAPALSALLADAGFTDITIETVELSRRHVSFEEMWETTLDLSRAFHDAVLARPQAEILDIRASLAERFAPYTSEQGALAIPARAILAAAGA